MGQGHTLTTFEISRPKKTDGKKTSTFRSADLHGNQLGAYTPSGSASSLGLRLPDSAAVASGPIEFVPHG